MTETFGSKSEVVARLRAHQSRMPEFGVRKLGIFGSVVRDEATSNSDVDVLVEFDPDRKTFDNFMQFDGFRSRRVA